MSLHSSDRENFETLLKAAKNDDLALVECTDKKTGAYVAAVCAIHKEGGEYVVTPIAKLFVNPYEEINPPEK